MAERSKVFIAYCFPEKRWLDRVQAAIEPFAGSDRFVVWDERKLKNGIAWKNELPDVLASAKVAMMIVSDLFLDSDFITRAKLPALLEKERESGLQICWVLAGHCLFELAGLKEADMGNRVGSAFDGLGLAQRDAEVASIAKKVAGYLGVEADMVVAEPAPKRPLLPSAIPQVLEPKPVRKRKRNVGLQKGVAEDIAPAAKQPEPPPQQQPAPLPEKADPVISATPSISAELPPPPPVPVESAPVAKPAEPAHPAEVLPMALPTKALEAAKKSETELEPAVVDVSPAGSARELSLQTMIQTRQATVLKLSRLARWLVFFSIAIALGSIAVMFLQSLEHFLIVAGFAVFVLGLALWLHARARFLGQGLVSMRYTGTGLADDALPTRQRETLMRKADEYLAQN